MASLSSDAKQDIENIFRKEIECAKMLSQSLDLEYKALAERHADTLENVVREKQERVQQLELVSIQREELLVSHHVFNATDNNTKNKSYQFNSNEKIAALWNELVDIAEKCREKNRINGSIVELVSKQSRHALDILQGILPDVSSISELYDNAGQTTKSANKRSLVQV